MGRKLVWVEKPIKGEERYGKYTAPAIGVMCTLPGVGVQKGGMRWFI